MGIPRHPLKSNSTYPLRSNSREWVFGYTHRIPYTHPPWSISAVDLQKNRRVEGVPKKLNCRLLIIVSITLFWLSWGPPHGAHPSNFSYTPCPNSGLPLISGWVGWAQMPVCPLFKGVWTSGYLGIPRRRLAPYLRDALDKWIFGYTQLPT